MPPVINKEKCSGCGLCAEICPLQVFRWNKEKDDVPLVKFPRECWHCNACALDCPTGAVTLKIPMPYMLAHVDASTLKP